MTEPELLRWDIVQEGRLQAALPWILLAIFVLVGTVVSAVRSVVGFSERGMGIAIVATFLAIAAGFMAHVFMPGGTVSVAGDELTIERRFRSPMRVTLAHAEVKPLLWAGQAANLSGLAAGMQVEVSATGQSITLGAPGHEVSRRAREASLDAVRRPPHVMLSETDFLELLEVLWNS